MKEKLEVFGYKHFVAEIYLRSYVYIYIAIDINSTHIPIGIYEYLCIPI